LVEQLAGWGVRFIKYDFSATMEEAEGIALAVNKTNLPIVLSMNGMGSPQYGTMFRVTGDMWDLWSYVADHFGVLTNWGSQGRPGHWPDSDMLPLGRIGGLQNVTSVYDKTCTAWQINCGACCGSNCQECCPRQSRFTPNEVQTVMSLWTIVRSPLIFGGDFPQTDKFTLSLVKNPEALDINSKGSNPQQVRLIPNDQAVWKSYHDRGVYVALFNLKDDVSQTVLVDYAALNITGSSCNVRDIWARQEAGLFKSSYSRNLEPHASALVSIYDCKA